MDYTFADGNDSDVFMDSVNRQIAMKMLVSAAHTSFLVFADHRKRSVLQDGQRAGNSSS